MKKSDQQYIEVCVLHKCFKIALWCRPISVEKRPTSITAQSFCDPTGQPAVVIITVKIAEQVFIQYTRSCE